jgi:outer membrane protein OmpA-like peptidoglycan-associated protein
MRAQVFAVVVFGSFLVCAARSQPAPIYKVTVIERTVKAINYQYRGGATQIDFTGTILLPQAKGKATVESKSGRTEIDVRFSNLSSPSRYGGEYLTYVLWAITPEGRAQNLGEVMGDASDRGHVAVTTDQQAFAMIVTAEPYAAVRQPSDVVVMENIVRSDTIGRIEPIQAKYALLPRGHYTFTKPDSPQPEGPKVSMSRYESLLQIYQAQNAIQIARAQGADRYAADTLARADNLLTEARRLDQRNAGRSAVVMMAREAAQTAEDARTIAMRHKQDAQLADAHAALAHEKELRKAAERAARSAEARASEDRAELDMQRAERERAESKSAAPPAPEPEPSLPLPSPRRRNIDAEKSEARVQLTQRMRAYFETIDTPRGLAVTLPDRDFQGVSLDPAVAARIVNLASIIAGQSGLRIEIEGHGEQWSGERAEAVRYAVLRGGMPAGGVATRDCGTTLPLVSNATASGREQNRRVEIVISGEPIGTLASWDRKYSLR